MLILAFFICWSPAGVWLTLFACALLARGLNLQSGFTMSHFDNMRLSAALVTPVVALMAVSISAAAASCFKYNDETRLAGGKAANFERFRKAVRRAAYTMVCWLLAMPMLTIWLIQFIAAIDIYGVEWAWLSYILSGLVIVIFSVFLAELSQLFALALPHFSVASRVCWQVFVAIVCLLIIWLTGEIAVSERNILFPVIVIFAGLSVYAYRATRLPNQALWDRL